ncbi:foldase protein PrsA [Egbenema bharatensis]|uniref:foldase protein PrsA n=1 Tax=Egbenema bharatensis TaxID=3463334 RepID=UPI003A8572F8
MNTPAFLYIDSQPIPIDQILRYLHTSGQLESFISTVLHQHILEQALQSCPEAHISLEQVERMIAEFRQQKQLVDDQCFQQWLAQEGTTEIALKQDIMHRLRLEQFVPTIVEPKLQETFINQKLYLDQVVLSQLVVDSQELAEELKTQITEEGASFEQLVREYSVSDDRLINGMMGALSRGQLSDGLRAMIDVAQPGDIVGPLEFEQQWFLYRVEQFIPASLADEAIQTSLQTQIFEEWMAERMRDRHVELQLAS